MPPRQHERAGGQRPARSSGRCGLLDQRAAVPAGRDLGRSRSAHKRAPLRCRRRPQRGPALRRPVPTELGVRRRRGVVQQGGCCGLVSRRKGFLGNIFARGRGSSSPSWGRDFGPVLHLDGCRLRHPASASTIRHLRDSVPVWPSRRVNGVDAPAGSSDPAGACGAGRYCGVMAVMEVPQLARATRVPPQRPNGAARYCS